MKVLLLDTETAPHLAYLWGLYKQTVSLNQIKESGHLLCWAAKWLGEEVQFDSIQNKKPIKMLSKIHKLLDEADVVVHYNGRKFDIPVLNREFIVNGFNPPSPYKQVDLLQVARSQFKFASNKLDYVLKALKIGQKVETGGFELWRDCMAGNKEAWARMQKYNIADVVEMEKLYLKLRPWIKGHPNPAMFSADKDMCPTCGSESYQHRGYYRGATYVYKRYCCNSCGKWFRSSQSFGGKQVQHVGVN